MYKIYIFFTLLVFASCKVSADTVKINNVGILESGDGGIYTFFPLNRPDFLRQFVAS